MSDVARPREADLAALAKELPVPPCSSAHREEQRTALLACARTRRLCPMGVRGTRRYVLLAAVAAAVVVAAGLAASVRHTAAPEPASDKRAAGDPDRAPRYRAVVRPHVGARVQRVSAAPDEVVRVHEGVVDFDVAALLPGERFRVVLGDGEVEVRGTAFSVTVADDRLLAVRVHRGAVDVKAGQTAPLRLEPGQQWSAVEPDDPDDAVAPSPGARRRRSLRAAEAAFHRGWLLLKRGDAEQAARAFTRADDQGAGGRHSLAEDASFWRAVALGRAGHDAQARAAFQAFLARFPSSDREGEAAAVLGWLLIDAGDRRGAERHFRGASTDPREDVRASARAGLAAAAAGAGAGAGAGSSASVETTRKGPDLLRETEPTATEKRHADR